MFYIVLFIDVVPGSHVSEIWYDESNLTVCVFLLYIEFPPKKQTVVSFCCFL
jgi:hypothetical protein